MRAFLLALASVAALITTAPAAQAACAPIAGVTVDPSCFEGGDGDLVPSGADYLDWESPALDATRATTSDPTGAADTQFGGGNLGKENDPGAWGLILGNNQPKVDIIAAASASERLTVAGDPFKHLFLYGAFRRVGNSGDANLSFEFNKNPGLFDNDGDPSTPEVPIREPNDVLVTFDGGASPVIGVCLWDGDRLGETSDPASGWKTLDGKKISGNQDCTPASAAGFAVGRMNVAPTPGDLPNTSGKFPEPEWGNPIPASTFGEIAIDITEAFQRAGIAENPCLAFGSFWLHSRSSTSAVSQMADYVAPKSISTPADNACALNVDKKVATNGGVDVDGTNIDPSYANTGDTLDFSLAVTNPGTEPLTVTEVLDPQCTAAPTIAPADKKTGMLADASPATLDPGDTWTYRCSRVLGGADATPFTNEVTVHAVPVGETEPVLEAKDQTVTNRFARLRIDKALTGDLQQPALPFSFTSLALGGFTLSADGGEQAFANLVPGDYGVAEDLSATPEYVLSGIVCSDGSTPAGSGVTVTLSQGEDVLCTFTNRRKTFDLTVTKVLDPASDSGKFDLLIDGIVRAAAVGDGGTTGAVPVVEGQHGVQELGALGTNLGEYVSSLSCTNGNGGTTSGAVSSTDGQDVTCTFTNTRKARVIVDLVTQPNDTATPKTGFPFASSLPAGTGIGGDGGFVLTDGASVETLVAPGAYQATMADPVAFGYRMKSVTCTDSVTADSSASAGTRQSSIAAQAGETVRCTYVVERIDGQALVVKAGAAFAYHGDQVTYTFVVTAGGNSAISDVAVSDDRCSPVVGPVAKDNGDGDALLEPFGTDGTSERWTYTCTTTLGAHAAGEEDPIVNTVTVTGKDEAGRPLTAQAKHVTDVLHVGISLVKTGPATAVPSRDVPFDITITNTGDTAFPEGQITLTDQRCKAAPVLKPGGKGGDATPGTLDPGESWVYTCSAATFIQDGEVVNEASVAAVDVNGRPAGSVGRVTVPLALSGNVSLRSLANCYSRGTRRIGVTVAGRGIARVDFYRNGKLFRTLTNKTGTGAGGVSLYRAFLPVSSRMKSNSAQRIVAKVTYRQSTGLGTVRVRARPFVIKKSCFTTPTG